MGPHPAVAAIRLAVRRALHDILSQHAAGPAGPGARPAPRDPQPPALAAAAPPGPHPTAPAGPAEPADATGPDWAAGILRSRRPFPAPDPDAPLVLVACSGGADSMALASALAFEAPRLGIRAGGVTVDHRLQEGSGRRAAEVAARLTALRLTPVDAVAVDVGRAGGPEAAAREARYAALDAVAAQHGATAILLGHTRDDQAETVLLGLARGSGTRSLSGMAEVSGPGGRYRRPFLRIDRQTARKACMVQSLPVWDDPHNTDPAYTRSRLRHEGLPALEKSLGKGVVEALARTAQLSRDDADALDAWAARAATTVRDEHGALDCAGLYALPAAVRRRVLRAALLEAGAPGGALFAAHIEEVDRLITAWRGQRALNLPGKVEARRLGGRLVIRQG
ncbi:tRNA lysidine(34) synthetase TilS [Streptomyces sp. P6-2-1]|uniref:tRNA lysidine(34) synthetase TilS n=1 Tax=unclassified Streptomyces TaxID=2593676 RepID=UPI003D367556